MARTAAPSVGVELNSGLIDESFPVVQAATNRYVEQYGWAAEPQVEERSPGLGTVDISRSLEYSSNRLEGGAKGPLLNNVDGSRIEIDSTFDRNALHESLEAIFEGSNAGLTNDSDAQLDEPSRVSEYPGASTDTHLLPRGLEHLPIATRLTTLAPDFSTQHQFVTQGTVDIERVLVTSVNAQPRTDRRGPSHHVDDRYVESIVEPWAKDDAPSAERVRHGWKESGKRGREDSAYMGSHGRYQPFELTSLSRLQARSSYPAGQSKAADTPRHDDPASRPAATEPIDPVTPQAAHRLNARGAVLNSDRVDQALSHLRIDTEMRTAMADELTDSKLALAGYGRQSNPPATDHGVTVARVHQNDSAEASVLSGDDSTWPSLVSPFIVIGVSTSIALVIVAETRGDTRWIALAPDTVTFHTLSRP